ncbi:MAG: C45 family autoproteolytic acyltransferase/hydrolase [Rhizobiaceae bacterium]
MKIQFERLDVPRSDTAWAQKFTTYWPKYRKWFLSQGVARRETYLSGRRAIAIYMPELLPIYDDLCELAGGGDLASRFLSFYRPPPYMAGCSQAIWSDGVCRLVRNYDYDLNKIDATVVMSRWGGRNVLAMTDGLWGVVDGINDAGLAASLAFGGRKIVGKGFGIPIILRYVLQVCVSVREAKAALEQVPCNMAYSVTVLDRMGDYVTAYLSPEEKPKFTRKNVVTNHQDTIAWAKHARITASPQRQRHLLNLLSNNNVGFDDFRSAFLQRPLFSTNYARGFGTIYTSVYVPEENRLELHWPEDLTWHHDFESKSKSDQLVCYPSI